MLPLAPTLRASPVALLRSRDGDERMHDRRTFVRVRAGVYAPTAEWAELTPWDRYLARVHAFALTRPGVPFAFESAAALLGLPLFGHPRDIHVFDARRSRSVRYGDVAVHTSIDGREIETDGMLGVTVVRDTVLDLLRVLPHALGLALVDAALRDGAADLSEMRDRVTVQHNRQGRTRATWSLDRGTPASESVGESISRAVIEFCGFPSPALQSTHIVAGRRFRSDFAWPDLGVLGESDGWGKYDLDDTVAAARALRSEKVREDLLRRDGWSVARWDYAGALRVTPLRDALLSAGLPLVRSPQTARLLAPARNPRSTHTPDKHESRW